MNLPNTIGLMFIYVHCQPCDPRGLAKRFLCTDCSEKTRSSRGGKTAYGSIAPFCIRWSSVVTKLLLRVCKKEGSCRTSVKPLVGLHLSVGLWLAVSFITQGLLRIPYQWLEPWVGLLKETKKYIFRHYSKTNSCLNIVPLKSKHGFDFFFVFYVKEMSTFSWQQKPLVAKPGIFAYDWHSSAHFDQLGFAAGRWQMSAPANSIIQFAKGGGTSLGEVDRTRRGGDRVQWGQAA